MSNVVTWSPALSAAAQATIARHQELQKLVQQREDMFKAIANKIKDWGDVTSFNRMDKFADVIADQQLSVDTVIDNNEYDYVFGEDENQNDITVYNAFQDMIAAHDACFTGETQGAVAYTANKFKNNLDIIYAPKGVADSSMASCFEGCYNLLAIGDIDFSAVTTLDSVFKNCRSLRIDNLILDVPLCTTMASMFNGATIVKGNKLTIKAPLCTSVYQGGLSKFDELEFIDSHNFTAFGDGTIGSVKKITGLDMSKVTDSYGAFLQSKLQEVHLVEGSYILYKQSIRGGNSSNSASSRNGGDNVIVTPGVSDQVRVEFLSHIYDWTRNEDGLTDLALVQQEYPFHRSLNASANMKQQIAAYCAEHSLLGCDNSMSNEDCVTAVGNFITGRGWSW